MTTEGSPDDDNERIDVDQMAELLPTLSLLDVMRLQNDPDRMDDDARKLFDTYVQSKVRQFTSLNADQLSGPLSNWRSNRAVPLEANRMIRVLLANNLLQIRPGGALQLFGVGTLSAGGTPHVGGSLALSGEGTLSLEGRVVHELGVAHEVDIADQVTAEKKPDVVEREIQRRAPGLQAALNRTGGMEFLVYIDALADLLEKTVGGPDVKDHQVYVLWAIVIFIFFLAADSRRKG